MKRTKYLALLFLLSLCTMLQAQEATTANAPSQLPKVNKSSCIVKDCKNYSRISLGYMRDNLRFIVGDVSLSEDEDKMNGATIGYTGGICLSKKVPIFFELGFQMNTTTTSKKAHINGSSVETRLNRFAFSFPINLSYKITFRNDFSIAPYAGIHFDLGLVFNEKATITNGSTTTTAIVSAYSTTVDHGSFKRFQMGYQAGANIGFNKHLSIGVGYKASFLPMYKENNVKVLNGGPVVSLGVNF